MEVKFSSSETRLKAEFVNACNSTDGGYARGYEQGYTKGQTDGYNKGKTDGYSQGLAERQYEVWTITLTDGSIVEKEVALL